MELFSSPKFHLKPLKFPPFIYLHNYQNHQLCSFFSLAKTRRTSKFSLQCSFANNLEPQPHKFNKPNGESYGTQRVFVGYSIYKGKSALTIGLITRVLTFWLGSVKLVKEGSVLLEFARAIGVRKYDWNKKQVFSLSVSEIGALVGLGARDSCEFIHDPNKRKSDEGKIRKFLKVEPLPDGSGHFFSISVQNKLMNVDESIYTPVSKAEFTVLVSAFNFILPYLLGWHAFANSVRPDEASRLIKISSQSGADLEWSR